MKMVRSVTAAALAATMLATSVTPALAQGYPGGGYSNRGYDGYGRNHRRHDRIGAGEVIGGLAILGVIAAIASSGSKRNRSYDDSYRGGINTENAAADACAAEVERAGGRQHVSGIDTVTRTRDGYSVRGTVDTGEGGYGYGRNDRQRFSCEVRYGAVESVRIDDNRYGSRRY
jgi:hypothetical protein